MENNIYFKLANIATWKEYLRNHENGSDKRAGVLVAAILNELDAILERISNLLNHYKSIADATAKKLSDEKRAALAALFKSYKIHKVTKLKEMATKAFHYYVESYEFDKNNLKLKKKISFSLPESSTPLQNCADGFFQTLAYYTKGFDRDFARINKYIQLGGHVLVFADVPFSFDHNVLPILVNVEAAEADHVKSNLRIVISETAHQITIAVGQVRSFIQKHISQHHRESSLQKLAGIERTTIHYRLTFY